MPPDSSIDYPSCLLDRLGVLGRAFAANGPLAIIVDALVFSSSLLHEVVPLTRGRRFGVFTFLFPPHLASPLAGERNMSMCRRDC